jgi:4-amino-4-deoxychorismate lyase
VSYHWLINGQPRDTVAVTDRGLTYADGLFETIAVREGQARLVEYHLQRLTEGCSRLSIPVDLSQLREEIDTLAAGQVYGILKVLLTRGSGPRGYAAPQVVHPTRIVGMTAAQPPAADAWENGVRVCECRTAISSNPATAGLKTLGRLEQVLARSEWSDPEICEGLMRNTDGLFICGTMSNLFVVSEDGLRTPDLSCSGVRGVMRRLIIEQAAQLGLNCVETDITAQALYDAEEVFLSNSQFGIWPVARIEDRGYTLGPVTRRLMAALASGGISECRL